MLDGGTEIVGTNPFRVWRSEPRVVTRLEHRPPLVSQRDDHHVVYPRRSSMRCWYVATGRETWQVILGQGEWVTPSKMTRNQLLDLVLHCLDVGPIWKMSRKVPTSSSNRQSKFSSVSPRNSPDDNALKSRLDLLEFGNLKILSSLG
jgi:hypothetical protein